MQCKLKTNVNPYSSNHFHAVYIWIISIKVHYFSVMILHPNTAVWYMDRQPNRVPGWSRGGSRGWGYGEKKETSTKPLRNCSTQTLLFIEAGLKQENDRHLWCTWSTTALTQHKQTQIYAYWNTFGTNTSSFLKLFRCISTLFHLSFSVYNA